MARKDIDLVDFARGIVRDDLHDHHTYVLLKCLFKALNKCTPLTRAGSHLVPVLRARGSDWRAHESVVDGLVKRRLVRRCKRNIFEMNRKLLRSWFFRWPVGSLFHVSATHNNSSHPHTRVYSPCLCWSRPASHQHRRAQCRSEDRMCVP